MKNLGIKNLPNPRKASAMPRAISVLPLRSAAKFIGELTACLMNGAPADKVKTTRSEAACALQHERRFDETNETDSKLRQLPETVTRDIEAAGLAAPQYTPLTERTISIPLERKQTKPKREEATDLVSKLNSARPASPRNIEVRDPGLTELASSGKEAGLAAPAMKQPAPQQEVAANSGAELHSVRSSMPQESAVRASESAKSALQLRKTTRILPEMRPPAETPKQPARLSTSPTASPLNTVAKQDTPKNALEVSLLTRNVPASEVEKTDGNDTRSRLRSEGREPESQTRIPTNTAEAEREEAQVKIQIPSRRGQTPRESPRIQRFDDLVPRRETIPIQTPVVRAERLERQGDAIRAQNEPPQQFVQDASNAMKVTEQRTLGKATVSARLQQHGTSSAILSPPREERTSRLPTQNNSVRPLSSAESVNSTDLTSRAGNPFRGTKDQPPVEIPRISTTSHETPVSKSKSESKEASILTYAPTRVVRKTDVSNSVERKLPLHVTAKAISDATSSPAMRTLTADRPTTSESPKGQGVEARTTEGAKRQSKLIVRDSASMKKELPAEVSSISQTRERPLNSMVSSASSVREDNLSSIRTLDPLKGIVQQGQTEFPASGGIQKQKASQVSQFTRDRRTEKPVEPLHLPKLKSSNSKTGGTPRKYGGDTQSESRGQVSSIEGRAGFVQETPMMPRQMRPLAMPSQQLNQEDAHAEIANYPATATKAGNAENFEVNPPIPRQSPLLAKAEQLQELRTLLQQVLKISQPLRLDKGSGLRFLWASQEWGPVQFVIGQHEQEVVARVQVQDPKVKVLLETHREGLQQIFAEQGLRLDRFEVDTTHEPRLPSIPEVQWDEPHRRQTRQRETVMTTLSNSDEESLTEPLLLAKRPTERRLWIA